MDNKFIPKMYGFPVTDGLFRSQKEIDAYNSKYTYASGYVQTQRANANLKWETSTQWNFGLDYTLLNNSLYGSFDYYIKKTTGILFPSHDIIGDPSCRVRNSAGLI